MLTKFLTRTPKNPYNFSSMRVWVDDIGTENAYVGYCYNGDIYLTFDIRGGPVFSSGCCILKNGIASERYRTFSLLDSVLVNRRWITVYECSYKILNSKTLYKYCKP